MLNRNNKPIKRNKVLQSKGVKLNRAVRLKVRPVSDEKKVEQHEQRVRDEEFYTAIWSERGPHSEISGTYLGAEVNKAYCHHIVAKASWKEGRYIKENLILMTIDEHSNVEVNSTMYEEVNKRRERIRKKYIDV